MRYKRGVTITLCFILIFLLSVVSFASNGNNNKVVEFTTTNSNFSCDSIKEKYTKDGVTYNLKDIKYKVLKKEAIKGIKENSTSFTEYENNKYAVGNIIKINDVEYTITKVIIDDTIIKNRTETLNHSTVLGYYTEQPTAPATERISYNDKYSKKTVTAESQLTEITATPPTWLKDFDIPIVIYGVDGEYYKIGDTLISSDNTFEDMYNKQTAILNYLNLDTSKYKLTKFEWDGGVYTNEKGLQCRNVKATGERYASQYIAYYSANDVNLPDCAGYNITCFYNTVNDNTGKYKYTVKATATYLPEKKSNAILYTSIATGVAVGCFLFWYFALNNVVFYVKGKRVFATKIHKGTIKANKLSKYKDEAILGKIVKRYVIKNPKKEIKIIANGTTVKKISIPVSKEAFDFYI